MGRSDDLCTPTSESHCGGPDLTPASAAQLARAQRAGSAFTVEVEDEVEEVAAAEDAAKEPKPTC